ncbi:MAG: ankyrin repeat domain-containing protein [Pirellulales bacterium]|nr:ankyrin repeat domain-containing protein [Pirellulales bacterium]
MATEYKKLLDAINGGNVYEAERLIETGLDLNIPFDEGATPLYAAILNGHKKLVRMMLERGANPNFVASEPAASTYTEKPLDLAMQARFLMDWDRFHPIVETLIEYGATDFEGEVESPYDLAVREQRARDHQRNNSA